MIDSVFSILGFDINTLNVPDTALVAVTAMFFLVSIDWIFRIVYLVIATLTKKRRG